jgi:hypothetical protein
MSGNRGDAYHVIVDKYLAALHAHDPALQWSQVAFVEVPLDGSEPPTREPVPADEFEARFDEIRAMGSRDWLNLRREGVRSDRTLVLSLEYYSEPFDGRIFPWSEVAIIPDLANMAH